MFPTGTRVRIVEAGPRYFNAPLVGHTGTVVTLTAEHPAYGGTPADPVHLVAIENVTSGAPFYAENLRRA